MSIKCSKILARQGSLEIGRKLLRSLVEPPLCSGETYAVFHRLGILSVERVRLKIWVMMSEIVEAANNKSFGSSPSAPVDFLGSMASRASFTSTPLKCLKVKLWELGLSWTGLLGVYKLPKRLPAAMKCLLKTLHR